MEYTPLLALFPGLLSLHASGAIQLNAGVEKGGRRPGPFLYMIHRKHMTLVTPYCIYRKSRNYYKEVIRMYMYSYAQTASVLFKTHILLLRVTRRWDLQGKKEKTKAIYHTYMLLT